MSIALIIAIIIIILVIKWLKPDFLVLKKIITKKSEGLLTIDDEFNISKADKTKELNALLDKINSKGIHKLSQTEKERLKELSK